MPSSTPSVAAATAIPSSPRQMKTSSSRQPTAVELKSTPRSARTFACDAIPSLLDNLFFNDLLRIFALHESRFFQACHKLIKRGSRFFTSALSQPLAQLSTGALLRSEALKNEDLQVA